MRVEFLNAYHLPKLQPEDINNLGASQAMRQKLQSKASSQPRALAHSVSTREHVSLCSAWSTEQSSGQPELHGETLFPKFKIKNKKSPLKEKPRIRLITGMLSNSKKDLSTS